MKREKPLAIDLYCGLGGWSEGLLAEGWRCVGFDIEAHDYGTGGYPGQLVIQDVLTLHGSQFKTADLIVCSPPCQEFSYMAMPWSRAKQIERALRDEDDFPAGYTGSCTVAELTRLFDACFRIQREASEAAGRHIPLIVENVRGAVKWVSQPVRWNFGSYYLWGDVPALMPITFAQRMKVSVSCASKIWSERPPNIELHNERTTKTVGHANIRDGHTHTRHLTNQRESEAIKQHGSGAAWFDNGICRESSKSNSRKAASAMIAKIPFPVAQHIAVTFKEIGT